MRVKSLDNKGGVLRGKSLVVSTVKMPFMKVRKENQNRTGKNLEMNSNLMGLSKAFYAKPLIQQQLNNQKAGPIMTKVLADSRFGLPFSTDA
jgi:hypothetical protein